MAKKTNNKKSEVINEKRNDNIMTEEINKTQSQNVFNIGDKVLVNGNLYANNDSSVVVGTVINYVAIINGYMAGAKHPYGLSGNIGWVSKSSIKKYKNITYKVKKGDKIEDIANKYNMSWQELYARNKFIIGNNPENIKQGMIITVC